jgi:hypothetical protein
VTEALHQGVIGLSFAVLTGQLLKPFTEESIEGFVLGFGERASLLDEVFIGRESDVFHGYSVHENRVQVMPTDSFLGANAP